MIFIIILICIVLLFTIMITLYLEKNKPNNIKNDTDDVSIIFDDDKDDDIEII